MERSEVPPGPEQGEPPADQEELQRRLEEQLRKVRVQDLLLESVASILNLSARRISKVEAARADVMSKTHPCGCGGLSGLGRRWQRV